jgi:hypothetical protein
MRAHDLVRGAWIAWMALCSCDRAAPPSVRDGGPLRGCYTEAACDGLRAGDRCYFAQPHAVAREGFCAPAERPCAVSSPYCGVDGRTVYACRFPAVPWTHAGPCAADAAPP